MVKKLLELGLGYQLVKHYGPYEDEKLPYDA
jgi:hypothetical protein